MGFIRESKTALGYHRQGSPYKRGGRYGSLGDVFCLEGDCQVGEMLVNQMITFFALVGPRTTFSADPVQFKKNLLEAAALGTAKQKAFHAKFGPAYSEIVDEYFRLETETTLLGIKKKDNPFSVNCCSIKELGRKAQTLTAQAHSFMGSQAPTPTLIQDPFDPSSGLFGNALSGGMSLIKLGLVAFIGITAYNAVKKG